MLHQILVALAVTLGYPHAPSLLTTIERHAPDERIARVMTVWAAKESGFRNDRVGDRGRARCFLQLRDRGDLSPDACAEAWLGALRAGMARCGGTLDGGLRSLSSGRCTGAYDLVKRRLAEAGVEP